MYYMLFSILKISEKTVENPLKLSITDSDFTFYLWVTIVVDRANTCSLLLLLSEVLKT